MIPSFFKNSAGSVNFQQELDKVAGDSPVVHVWLASGRHCLAVKGETGWTTGSTQSYADIAWHTSKYLAMTPYWEHLVLIELGIEVPKDHPKDIGYVIQLASCVCVAVPQLLVWDFSGIDAATCDQSLLFETIDVLDNLFHNQVPLSPSLLAAFQQREADAHENEVEG